MFISINTRSALGALPHVTDSKGKGYVTSDFGYEEDYDFFPGL